MRRRDFFVLLGSAAAYRQTAAHAQHALPLIGWLSSASPHDYHGGDMQAFKQGLTETGYLEGRNFAIEYRWAEGQYDRFDAFVADFVVRRVTVIAAVDTAAALAAKAASTTTPIVFRMAADPVAAGLIVSLSRPGGNITGVTTLNLEVGPKRLELLHELIPTATVVAALINPNNAGLAPGLSRDLQVAARALGLRLHVLHASTDHEIDAAFTALTELRAGGLVIGTDPFFVSRGEKLATLALRYRVPTVYQWRDFVAAGGLMSYGGNLRDSYRLAGVYTGRILDGQKSSDLPVQQATKLELFINLKTAAILDISVPPALLARADEVIE